MRRLGLARSRLAILLPLLLLTGCGLGHAIGGYFTPVSTMSTDRFKALEMERALAMEYVSMKVRLTEACRAQTIPVGICDGLVQLARDFEAADVLVRAQLYDPSTSAFDLGKLTSLITTLMGVATTLAPLGL